MGVIHHLSDVGTTLLSLSVLFFCVFCAHPIFHYLLTLFISPCPSRYRRNTDPGSKNRLFSPLPTTVGAFIFIARTSSSFFFPSRRLASNRSQAACKNPHRGVGPFVIRSANFRTTSYVIQVSFGELPHVRGISTPCIYTRGCCPANTGGGRCSSRR